MEKKEKSAVCMCEAIFIFSSFICILVLSGD